MALLRQLRALRINEDLRNGSSEHLDAHIRSNILGYLQSISLNTPGEGSDRTNHDLLNVSPPITALLATDAERRLWIHSRTPCRIFLLSLL